MNRGDNPLDNPIDTPIASGRRDRVGLAAGGQDAAALDAAPLDRGPLDRGPLDPGSLDPRPLDPGTVGPETVPEALDAVTLAVIQAGLGQVCNEMDITFSRAAFSPVIAEADDRSSGIYDLASGALIAQGELGLPVFVGTMQFSTAELIRLIGDCLLYTSPSPRDS